VDSNTPTHDDCQITLYICLAHIMMSQSVKSPYVSNLSFIFKEGAKGYNYCSYFLCMLKY
jgi:hypothetical protein